MNTRILALSLAAALGVPAVGTIAAAEEQPATTAAPAQIQPAEEAPPTNADLTQAQPAEGYLGVLLGPVPGALRAQLHGMLPSGRGVMIRDVADDSPAARAGLKTYDVITAYGDQKLYTADQLSSLVRAEKPATSVTLDIVRDGASQQVAVTLGELRVQAGDHGLAGMESMMARHHAPCHARPPTVEERSWEQFDSISLNKLEDGKFKAAIQYLGQDGKLVKQEFTGDRDDIRRQIMQQKDLPRTERHQLLQMLTGRDDFEPPMGWNRPGFFYPPPWFGWQPDF